MMHVSTCVSHPTAHNEMLLTQVDPAKIISRLQDVKSWGKWEKRQKKPQMFFKSSYG